MSRKKKRRGARSVTLTLHQGGAGRGTEPIIVLDEPQVELCGACGGPSFLCRGDHPEDLPEQLSPTMQRWLAALRAMHLGLALASTPAAGFGGALLTLARRLVTGTSVPEALVELAPDPRCRLSEAAATRYALVALLTKEDDWGRPSARAAQVLAGPETTTTLDVLRVLAAALATARARWVREVVELSRRAALASPILDHSAFELVAVVCHEHDQSPDRGRVPWGAYLRPAELHDNAIRCPICTRWLEHPLPFSSTRPDMPWPELHPVGRCQKGELAPGAIGCVTHRLDLGRDGMCENGRLLYERARKHIARRMAERDETTPLEPWEGRLSVALVYADQPERGGRLDERDAAGERVTFASELAEAMGAMGRDVAKLPGDLGSMISSMFGLTLPKAPIARYDLVARRGNEVADFLGKTDLQATKIERDLTAAGWTVTRAQRPRARRHGEIER
jgi:hypothetical protein